MQNVVAVSHTVCKTVHACRMPSPGGFWVTLHFNKSASLDTTIIYSCWVARGTCTVIDLVQFTEQCFQWVNCGHGCIHSFIRTLPILTTARPQICSLHFTTGLHLWQAGKCDVRFESPTNESAPPRWPSISPTSHLTFHLYQCGRG